MSITAFMDSLWSDYTSITPQADRIYQAFTERGETVVNDHVAFRTLALEPIGLAKLEPHLLALGYTPFEPYEFPAKKLRAYGYLPPEATQPRVFLSELLVEELSPKSADILKKLASQVAADAAADPSVMWRGPLWDPIAYDDYQQLVSESEYAAWFSTLGLRANHFTISVNHLNSCEEVEDVLQVVESLGYAINDSGGRVKGSPDRFLEQASTMADKQVIEFAGGEQHEVPTCYYEFAKRYMTPEGGLFQGFVAASADKIFESTDVRENKA
ncbi:MAG: DUF1338 domain-containing protein [Planctomycetota bacterium]